MGYVFCFCLILVGLGAVHSQTLSNPTYGPYFKMSASFPGSTSYFKQRGSYTTLKLTALGSGSRFKYRFVIWTVPGAVYVMLDGQSHGELQRSGNSIISTGWGSVPTQATDPKVWKCISVTPFNACDQLATSGSSSVIELHAVGASGSFCRNNNGYSAFLGCGWSKRQWWFHA